MHMRFSILFMTIFLATFCSSAIAQTPAEKIAAALLNIDAVERPNRIGYAGFWDGNKYVQCRRVADKRMRCEAAGSMLQPSLATVLSADRLTRLATLGWEIDPAFGNFAKIFGSGVPTTNIATEIFAVLVEGYGVNAEELVFATTWIADVPCPPRNGFSQNLAGFVNEAISMRPTALRGCSLNATPAAVVPSNAVTSVDELIERFGKRVTAEIQRVRINSGRVYFILETGLGYVQCQRERNALYCEAQSAASWPALASILTRERITSLHAAGYADPGRAQNYSRYYDLATSDADIVRSLLSVLYEAYGYRGVQPLTYKGN